ncbi:MAG: hypothetical protein H7Z13_09945 [Ferruginibacter sp.]|nr:hypothetical protein [Ferruginibacter sp.]
MKNIVVAGTEICIGVLTYDINIFSSGENSNEKAWLVVNCIPFAVYNGPASLILTLPINTGDFGVTVLKTEIEFSRPRICSGSPSPEPPV